MNKHFLKASQIAEQFRNAAGGVKRPLVTLRGIADGANWPMNKAELEGELFIYEQIGFDCWTGDGVTGKSVSEALAAIKGVKVLNVYINCEGGDVFEAKAIYSQLKRFDAEKIVHIDGIAASAATFIAMAGDKIITSPAATWMVHQAWSGAMGRAEDMRAMADLLDLENQTIAEIYAARTKAKVSDMLALMSAPPDGTWMNAATALEKGFTDEIGVEEVEADEEAEMKTSASGIAKIAAAISQTQRRLNTMSPGERMSATAEMMKRKTQPGPAPKPAKSASR